MIKGLEDFRIYNLAIELGQEVWIIVGRWSYFNKDTIGKQLVRSVDSIAANLAEGRGRYHLKEMKNFCYFSRGSLFETKSWIEKAKSRELISDTEFKNVSEKLEVLGRMLNSYIHSIGLDQKL